MKRILQSLFIVLCLLVAQGAAYVHELSHLDRDSAPAQNKHSPHARACIECGLLAQLGNGLAANVAPPHGAGLSDCAIYHRSWVHYAGIPRRFLSRAPPVFL